MPEESFVAGCKKILRFAQNDNETFPVGADDSVRHRESLRHLLRKCPLPLTREAFWVSAPPKGSLSQGVFCMARRVVAPYNNASCHSERSEESFRSRVREDSSVISFPQNDKIGLLSF